MNTEVLVDVKHLTHQFHLTKKAAIRAVDDISFQIYKGEVFGLVGESGSGKSTVARCLMNIYHPSAGEIRYHGIEITGKKEFRANKKMLQTKRQMIFQDCFQFESENESGRDYCGTYENQSYRAAKRQLCQGGRVSDAICGNG